VSITVTETGPLFDGRLERAIDAAVDEAEHQIAERGVTDVVVALAQVLQHPTGRYQAGVHTERAVGDWIVTDGGEVYGPWLAGVLTRNRTTRFKGYAHWRRARQRLQAEAPDIAEHVIAERIGGL
jgi:hypothetical protein